MDFQDRDRWYSINTGYIVKIRDWDDMVREFGYDRVNDLIPIPYCSFTREMRRFCGHSFKVDGLYADIPDYKTIRIELAHSSQPWSYGVEFFSFTTQMIEKDGWLPQIEAGIPVFESCQCPDSEVFSDIILSVGI